MSIDEERKKAFVVFASTYEAAVNHLTLEQMGELFLKMGRYSLEGEEVHSETPMVDVILKMTIPNMDAAERRHQTAIENGSKGKEHGNKGGRPRKGESREEYDARRLERAGIENPQKPLNKNTNTDINTNSNIDNDIDRNNEIDKNIVINKNTNIEETYNSISTNCSSFSFESSKQVEDETCHGEETEPRRPQHQTISEYSKKDEDDTKQGAEPRKEDRPRQRGDNGSKAKMDLIRSTSLDDTNEDDEVPPCSPDERYMNYIGSFQDILRYDAEPDYEGMTDAEMMDAAKESIDEAIETELRQGKTQRFWDLMHRAKKIYMHLNGCSEEQAKRGANWLYTQRRKVLQTSMEQPL